jgi:hypothetical protein
MGINFTSQFIRTNGEAGSFVLRMNGRPTAPTRRSSIPHAARNISLLWYIAMENNVHSATITDAPSSKRGISGPVTVRVDTGGTSSAVNARLPSFTVHAPSFASNHFVKLLKPSTRARRAPTAEPLDKVPFPPPPPSLCTLLLSLFHQMALCWVSIDILCRFTSHSR